jgi:ABC-2 type transport system permease protein
MMRHVSLALRQVRVELRSYIRNPQAAFFTFALPVFLIVVFGLLDRGTGTAPDGSRLPTPALFFPGIIAFTAVSTAYANLAMGVTLQREEGFLKRLRATPISRSVFISGHIGAAITNMVVAGILTGLVGAAFFHVHIAPSRIPLTLLIFFSGVACCCSLGIAVTAIIPSGEAAPALANGTYLPVALVSGVIPLGGPGPHWLVTATGYLPVRPLVDGMTNAIVGAGHVRSLLFNVAVLVTWLVIGAIASWRFFLWVPHREIG